MSDNHGFFWRGRNITMVVVGVEGGAASIAGFAAAWWAGTRWTWWLAPPAYVLTALPVLFILAAVVDRFSPPRR